jgi:hypothetical protein
MTSCAQNIKMALGGILDCQFKMHFFIMIMDAGEIFLQLVVKCSKQD